MARGRFAVLVLSETERFELKSLATRRNTAQALALRARIVLGCAEGIQNKQVAAQRRVDETTVDKWRRRFVEHRMDGLRDEPRSGPPRTIDYARIEAVIVRTLESTPSAATHWSSRGMARICGLSVSTVQRCRAQNLDRQGFRLTVRGGHLLLFREVRGGAGVSVDKSGDCSLTPFRSPRADAIAERWVRSLRTECLDHLSILNERHLRMVLAEYVQYFNHWRPHRSIGQCAPRAAAETANDPKGREVVAESILGGLHNVYHLAA